MPEYPPRQLKEPPAPDVLYDRGVRTRLWLPDPDRLVAQASLVDDSYAPGGYQRIHDMTLRVELSLPDTTITSADADMAAHPQLRCPGTIEHVQRLVGLRVAAGFFREVRSRLGGNRSCNHLLTLAQTVGTVVALSYAARMSVLDPALRVAPDDDYFRTVAEHQPGIVDSCYVWRGDGELATGLGLPRRRDAR